jgi:single-strand DNA-binding protein
MTDIITIAGVVGAEPELRPGNVDRCLLRVVTNRRAKDPQTGEWKDLDSNWYSVVAFRRLASNVHGSLHKGDRVLITGRLSVRQYETEQGQKGTSVEIIADAIGHDLNWGTTVYSKASGSTTPATQDTWVGDSVWPDTAPIPDDTPF